MCLGSACEEVVSVCRGRSLENCKAGAKRKLAQVKGFSEFTPSALFSFRRNKNISSLGPVVLDKYLFTLRAIFFYSRQQSIQCET